MIVVLVMGISPTRAERSELLLTEGIFNPLRGAEREFFVLAAFSLKSPRQFTSVLALPFTIFLWVKSVKNYSKRIR